LAPEDPGARQTLEDLVKKADEAMYENKRSQAPSQ